MITAPDKPEERETIKVIAGLIQSQMGLREGATSIYNQKRLLGKTSDIQVDVAWIGGKPYAANSRAVNDPAQPDLTEVQSVQEQEVIQVDIFSKSAEARLRKVEVIFALTGIAAQQACEKYGMRIGRIPASFVDLSEGEGAARLNRYALTFNVLRSYSLSRSVETFSTFENPPQISTNP